MANEWLTPFMHLRKNLRPLADSGDTFHHAAFLTQVKDPEVVSKYFVQLEPWYKYKKPPRLIISDKVGDDVWAHHCFFGKGFRGIETLAKDLRKLNQGLKDVPEDAREVLPRFLRHRIGLNEWGNLITWLHVLYHLAYKYQDSHLQAELLYASAVRGGNLEWGAWDLCPASSECDPMPLITRVLPKDYTKGLAPEDQKKQRWHPEGGNADLEYPDFLQACLTTDVISASLQAILLLKCYGVEPRVIPENFGLPGNGRGKKRNAEKEGSDDKILREIKKLWQGVINYHFPKDQPVIKTPMSQTRMAIEIMGWSKKDQYVISRRLAIVFASPKGGKPSEKAVKAIYKAMAIRGDLQEFIACWGNITREGLIGRRHWKQYTNQKTHDPEDRSGDDEEE